MSINRKLATGFTAAFLATGGLLAAGVGMGATSAVAAPVGHHHCPSKKGKYPPGKCTLHFHNPKVHRHHHETIQSGRVFKPREEIKVELVCPKTKHHKKYVHHYKEHHAGKSGALVDRLKISGKVPVGKCEIIVVGKHSHVKLTGHIHVKK